MTCQLWLRLRIMPALDTKPGTPVSGYFPTLRAIIHRQRNTWCAYQVVYVYSTYVCTTSVRVLLFDLFRPGGGATGSPTFSRPVPTWYARTTSGTCLLACMLLAPGMILRVSTTNTSMYVRAVMVVGWYHMIPDIRRKSRQLFT